tara:strand:- start:2367 stop:3962 length:1596 start_codon:yes stop_codon:yes gene_type:complete
MNKILFIADFFSDQISGGGELNNSVLINLLTAKGYEIASINSHLVNERHLSSQKNIIVANFKNLSEENKSKIQDKNYIIYEHDHKYLKDRNPGIYPEYKAPKEDIINREFYENAKAVLCQSSFHAKILKKNLEIDNIINLSGNLWSEEHFALLEEMSKVEKIDKYAIMASSIPHKNTSKAVAYCKAANAEYVLIPPSGPQEFLRELGRYKTLVFLPETPETLSRVVVEARMMGMRTKTTNNIGAIHEDWFSKKGLDLINYMRGIQEDLLDKVCFYLFSKKKVVKSADITVILNSYRRPYNLKKQIDAIRNQTKPPKEIWLWVNQHPDNENYSYKEFNIDKIFNNDYNWKFYGRFAGALLADTEYVAIFDDDTVPGKKWFENCLDTMGETEGILGSAGIILDDKYYFRHQRCGWPTHNSERVEVDLVGHAWFFKRDWLQYLWREKPPTWDNGEDIHFSYATQKYGGIKTYCPPHPPEDQEMHGSVMGNELGIDEKATSNNNETSHQQFFAERDYCVQEALRKGWKTVRGVKL